MCDVRLHEQWSMCALRRKKIQNNIKNTATVRIFFAIVCGTINIFMVQRMVVKLCMCRDKKIPSNDWIWFELNANEMNGIKLWSHPGPICARVSCVFSPTPLLLNWTLYTWLGIHRILSLTMTASYIILLLSQIYIWHTSFIISFCCYAKDVCAREPRRNYCKIIRKNLWKSLKRNFKIWHAHKHTNKHVHE